MWFFKPVLNKSECALIVLMTAFGRQEGRAGSDVAKSGNSSVQLNHKKFGPCSLFPEGCRRGG